MKKTLKTPPKAEGQQKRTHCECCGVPLAKAKMPLTMEGLLAWHGRWLNTQARFHPHGGVILEENLIYSAGYPLPQIEVLRDLWNHEHRKFVRYERRRRIMTVHELVITQRRFRGAVVNIADMVTRQRRRVQSVPIFA